jgi:hypothetical protein
MQHISLNYTPQWIKDVPEHVWFQLLLDKLNENDPNSFEMSEKETDQSKQTKIQK